jgi:hypothetical protein
MFNRPNNLADRIGADVDYRGVNHRKQHMMASGGPLVSHLFNTLEDAVAQFGRRIKVSDRVLKHSTPFRNGYAAKSYSPRDGADQQEMHEYGSGYLKRLLDDLTKPAVATPAPDHSDEV